MGPYIIKVKQHLESEIVAVISQFSNKWIFISCFVGSLLKNRSHVLALFLLSPCHFCLWQKLDTNQSLFTASPLASLVMYFLTGNYANNNPQTHSAQFVPFFFFFLGKKAKAKANQTKTKNDKTVSCLFPHVPQPRW